MPGSPVAALRDKYERIRVLREAHGRADEPDPRAEMAALADEFPGALKELDRLSMEEIVLRIAKLRAAEEDPTLLEGWMLAQSEVHRFARGALAAKRWLATNELDETKFRAALPTLREEAALFATALEDIAMPPFGRVMALVYQRAANELGITEPQLRLLLR